MNQRLRVSVSSKDSSTWALECAARKLGWAGQVESEEQGVRANGQGVQGRCSRQGRVAQCPISLHSVDTHPGVCSPGVLGLVTWAVTPGS